MICPCDSTLNYEDCCAPYHNKIKTAPTAEALMRSRFCAFALHLVDYLYQTTYPNQRKNHSKAAILNWAVSNKWMQLEIIKATSNTVEFKAHYLDKNLDAQVHHEKSTFKQLNGVWYYVDGVFY